MGATSNIHRPIHRPWWQWPWLHNLNWQPFWNRLARITITYYGCTYVSSFIGFFCLSRSATYFSFWICCSPLNGWTPRYPNWKPNFSAQIDLGIVIRFTLDEYSNVIVSFYSKKTQSHTMAPLTTRFYQNAHTAVKFDGLVWWATS